MASGREIKKARKLPGRRKVGPKTRCWCGAHDDGDDGDDDDDVTEVKIG